jgi:uncharacterized protein (DUF2252 family)
MLALDPLRLALRQLKIAQERTGRFPPLLAHKADRMSPSALALLRGSAPLFYEVLEHHPTLAEGPPGEGWLVGDCHLENFGAYRTDALSTKETKASPARDAIAFDLNDFDDAFIGPWRFDVLRLTTSLILAGRELGTDGRTTLALAEALIAAYVESAFRKRPQTKAPPAPHAVTALVEKVRARSRKELLDARTEIVHGERRFVRGARYEAIPPKLRARAEKAFAKYVKRMPDAERPAAEALTVIDATFRVAGTGSLGCLRIAVLVRGKGGPDGAWIFDMKEEGTPSAACLVRPPRLEPAERIVTAIRACVAHPPRMIGTTRLRGSSMFARRLAPQEDKIDFSRLKTADLDPLACHLGALLGAAHRRGATRAPKKAWNAEARAGVLERAIALSAMHEAMYLAYSQLVR